ncbi:MULTISPECIES: terminase large subunit domain-containing protein [Serratia]|uniref:terminase large subunit domain-containing protein n=1 Tax=Serratia TaxID=613 RepID=UPI0006609503|nr:terminase family protein [Serratia sp. 506_PEND]
MNTPKPALVKLTPPRKIDLTAAKAELGVDVPDALTLPADAPVFLPYQARWFADDSDVCIAEKSRRTGLTWAEAGRNVITAAKPKNRGGRNVFYVGSKQEMALEYIAACALFSKAFNQLAQADVYEQTFWDSEKKEEILTYMIRFPNSGFKIQALSSRPSNLRGLQGDVVIDEAAFHESLDELLKAAMALTMWGARVRIISTHNGVDNLFNQYIQEAREGRKDYSVHRITLDDAIADGLYQRICAVTGKAWSPEAEKKWRDDLYKNAPSKEDAEEEYGCVPKKSGGAYIPRALIEAAMTAARDIPILTYEADETFITQSAWQREAAIATWCDEHLGPVLAALDPDCRHAFGEDFARRGDLSCFTVLAIPADLRKREAVRVELRNLTYDQQKQVMLYILQRLPRFIGAAFDATGNGGYLAEAALLAFGPEMVDCVMLSPKWYAEWMPKLKAEFEDGNLTLARHQTTLDDLRHIKVVNGIPQIDKGRTKDANATAVGARRHGDFAVALCMANRASWMEGFVLDDDACQALPGRGRTLEAIGEDDRDDYPDVDRGCW